MESVTSTDGTEIAFERSGDGQPLVLVHGGTGDRHSWETLRPHVETNFEVVALDRRGRGDSGDAEAYGLDREVADVRAVVERLGGEPVLFGHSFGGLVALEAASEVELEGLVLYEPAILTGEHREGADLADGMQELVDDGRRREAAKLFFREAAGAEDPERLPVDRAARLVETVIRENRAIEGYRLDEAPSVDVATLLVTGEYGPDHLRDATRAVHDRLPESELVELPGVGHVAIESAPCRLAEAVRTFAGKREGTGVRATK
jgi:pimeloyl-ACP methyl ester carboxylesterase